MDIIQLPTIEELLAWATSKPQNLAIGKVASETECPIACYLNEHDENETRGWFVGGASIMTTREEDGQVVTPPELAVVITMVDAFYGDTGCDGYIYTPQFIHILQTVQESMRPY